MLDKAETCRIGWQIFKCFVWL